MGCHVLHGTIGRAQFGREGPPLVAILLPASMAAGRPDGDRLNHKLGGLSGRQFFVSTAPYVGHSGTDRTVPESSHSPGRAEGGSRPRFRH